MYTDYFGFREEPFKVTADPRFFYETPMYQEAYANLLSGIRERKGFLLLTGEAGIGKTTLLHRLMHDLEEPICCVFFDNASATFEELLSFLCAELGLPEEETGRLQKIRALNAFLLARMKEGGTGVLLIDEGQDLEDQVLENLRLLLNTQITAETPLFQTVLAGCQSYHRATRSFD
jgi:general secretion pathway protein A